MPRQRPKPALAQEELARVTLSFDFSLLGIFAACAMQVSEFGSIPWASYRSHGDPFPLSSRWLVPEVEKRGMCFPQRGAWTATALNNLALHGSSLNFDDKLHGLPPSVTQQSVVEHVLESFDDAGAPPSQLDGETALRELGVGNSLYTEEPVNLATFDMAKLKVLHSQLKPRRLEDMLPTYVKAVLRRYRTSIEKSVSEIAEGGPIDIKPYWDPKLRRSDSQLVELVVRLAQQGLVTFRRAIKERIGLFFVKKKDPKYIRMVIDSRRVNAQHRSPPTTRLSTPRSYLDIRFPPSHDDGPLAYGIEADVNDCFYNYFSEELASWFGIDRPGTVAFWREQGWDKTQIFDDETSSMVHVSDDEVIYPVFRGLCMGWGWSLYFANESVNHIVSGFIERPLQEIRDKAPLPDITTGPLTGVYVDNISIIGRTKEEVASAASAIAAHFEQVSIPLTWTTQEPQTVFETVGIILDFEKGRVRNKPKRIWRAFFAGREILRRRRVHGKMVEIWLGHMTSLAMLAPSALSCFFHIYKFVQQHRHHRAVLWGTVRQEMRNALGLIWLFSSPLRFDPICQVDAGDSSSGAYALLTTWANEKEVGHLCNWRESWRFQPLPISVKRAVETGSREKVIQALEELQSDWTPEFVRSEEVRACQPFGAGLQTQYADWLLEADRDDTSWLRTSSVKTQLRAKQKRKLEMEAPSMVVPIPDDICRRGRYTLLWRKRWRANDSHINVKEAAVCLSSLRRTARVRSLHHKVKVTLTDNLAALCSLERGRSSAFGLNRICQQACAYQLACALKWRLRHVETLRSPADEDSRFHEPKKQSNMFESKKHRKFRATTGPCKNVTAVAGNSCGRDGDAAIAPNGERRFSAGASSGPAKGVFLELFSGTGRLTHAMSSRGLAALTPVDITNGSHHDLRRRGAQLAVLAFIRSGRVRYVHLGTPCTVFSRARRFIRNQQRARDREQVGVELALFSAEVIETCERYGVLWSLENPRSSRLFELPVLRDILFTPRCFAIDVDFCRYGEQHKNPIRIFTSCPQLLALQKRCIHKKHPVVLRGSETVQEGTHKISAPKTRAAGTYPWKLADAWAECLGQEIETQSRDTRLLTTQLEHELRSCCQKTETSGQQIQTYAAHDHQLQQFVKEYPAGMSAVVFGQHSNQKNPEAPA
jgi:hypothetical protein